MTRNRQGQFPPPPDGSPERRRELRRETDYENQVIADHAVQDAPIVRGLLHTWKVAGAIGGLCALIASTGTAIGMSVRGPKQEIADVEKRTNARVDTNVAHIIGLRHEFDSVVVELRSLKGDIKTTTNLACISARARNPEVAKAAGCDERDP